MRLILLLLLVLPSISGFSQLVVEGRAAVSGDATEGAIGHQFEVMNSGTETELFYWDLVRSDDMPSEWEFTVCDANLCLPAGVESSDCTDDSYINALSAGQAISYYKVSLNPHMVEGEHTVEYRLVRTCGVEVQADDILAVVNITFSVSGGSDVSDLNSNTKILLYPNPTTDRFEINDDASISDIAIYNIVGKEIYAESHTSGMSHDITNLEKGIYLVRMLDTTQDVVKVLRLTKE